MSYNRQEFHEWLIVPGLSARQHEASTLHNSSGANGRAILVDDSQSGLPLLSPARRSVSRANKPERQIQGPSVIPCFSMSILPHMTDNGWFVASANRAHPSTSSDLSTFFYYCLQALIFKTLRLIRTVPYKPYGVFNEELQAMASGLIPSVRAMPVEQDTGVNPKKQPLQNVHKPHVGTTFTIETDDEDHDDIPYLDSDVHYAQLGPTTADEARPSRLVKAKVTEWSSSSEDEGEQHNAYSASMQLNAGTQEYDWIDDDARNKERARVARNAPNKRRRETYAARKAQPRRDSSTVATNSTASTAKRGTSEASEKKQSSIWDQEYVPPRQNIDARAEFAREKRLVTQHGLSQTTNAIDYRERKVREKELKAYFRGMLDQDIVDQVEAEGWITPDGRLFKAACRMLEKIQQEREEYEEVSRSQKRIRSGEYETMEEELQGVKVENERLKSAIDEMRELFKKVE